VDKIWQPDLFFVDEKDARRHQIIQRNSLLEISPEGDVFFSGF